MYDNWEETSMLVLSKFNWYLVDDVIDYLHELRTYIINTPGKFSASYMPQLKDRRHQSDIDQSSSQLYRIPASKEGRFPDDQVYLCEAIGDWSPHLDRLQLACNIAVNTNRLERKYPDIETGGQLEFYILDLVHSTLQILEAKEGFITQQVFEKRYGLNWSDQTKGILSNNQSSNSKE